MKFSFKVAFLESLNSASKISRYQKLEEDLLLAILLQIALVEESQIYVALLPSELPSEVYKKDCFFITHQPYQNKEYFKAKISN